MADQRDTPPFRPDPDIIGNAEGNERILRHDREGAIHELIEASSLGTPEAKAARASVPDEAVERVLAKAREYERHGEGLRYLPICEPCIAGEGSECHTPECALFLRDVPSEGLIAEFAVTAANLPAARPVVDRGALAEVLAGVQHQDYRAPRRYAEALADAVLAVVQGAADVRREVAEEIAAAIEDAASVASYVSPEEVTEALLHAARIARETGER